MLSIMEQNKVHIFRWVQIALKLFFYEFVGNKYRGNVHASLIYLHSDCHLGLG